MVLFLVAILLLFRPSLPRCFPIRGLSFEVSEVTLGSFWSQFGCFSILHCHGVFPSGDQQQQQQKLLQQQEEKVAKIHSSSKRKKVSKSSFSMGFRSYVRHWYFPVGRWFFPWCFSIRGPAAAVAKASAVVSEVTWCNFGASPSFTAWCFPIQGPAAAAAKASAAAGGTGSQNL